MPFIREIALQDYTFKKSKVDGVLFLWKTVLTWLARIGLDHHIPESEERLLAAAIDDCEGVMERSNQFKKRRREERAAE